MTKVAIKRALISVYDKTGLTELAAGLHAAGVQIISTGTTAATISAAGVPVTAVEELTGFPECLDGRVKTLHPKVHAGLLADSSEGLSDDDSCARTSSSRSSCWSRTCTRSSRRWPAAPVRRRSSRHRRSGHGQRASAKNHGTGGMVIRWSATYSGSCCATPRQRTAASTPRTAGAGRRTQAYARTAAYDAAVSSWFAAVYAPDEVAAQSGWPAVTGTLWLRKDVLRYGENPHQRAALYRQSGGATGAAGGGEVAGRAGGIADAEVLHGKAMSYNNYVDADAARRAAFGFTEPCVAIMKHANPCGIALGADLAEAHRKAHACDPVSAFGGVIAANGTVTAAMASQIAEIFTEVIIAPDFEPAALDILTAKKNQRLLRCAAPSAQAGRAGLDWRQVSGGMLMQTTDTGAEPGDFAASWKLVAGKAAGPEILADLEFAWRACRAVKSNAILLATGQASVGIGMGQVNRVDSCRLAVSRAGDRAAGSVAASDAFFPFADGLQILTEAGVTAIAEPGGSVRDDEVIAAAQAAGVALYFTGVRHFYH